MTTLENQNPTVAAPVADLSASERASDWNLTGELRAAFLGLDALAERASFGCLDLVSDGLTPGAGQVRSTRAALAQMGAALDFVKSEYEREVARYVIELREELADFEMAQGARGAA